MSSYYCQNCQSDFPMKDCPRCRENFNFEEGDDEE